MDRGTGTASCQIGRASWRERVECRRVLFGSQVPDVLVRDGAEADVRIPHRRGAPEETRWIEVQVLLRVRSEERRGGKEWSADVCSSDLRYPMFWCVTVPRPMFGSHIDAARPRRRDGSRYRYCFVSDRKSVVEGKSGVQTCALRISGTRCSGA